jgi:putative spermidine/putrescine transport system permease protein
MRAPQAASLADRLGIGLIVAVAILALGLLLMPAVVVVLMSFDTRLYISFPPQGFTLDWYRRVFAQPVLMGAMWTSIKVGTYVTVLCVLLGLPVALACVRGNFRGATAVSVYVLVPHMVPGIVLGVAVLFAGALLGIGPSIWLQSVSLACYVMAVMVRTLMSRLQRLDPVLEQASANLGATRWQTFRAVTFPLLLPAILAGAVFTFIEGFDNLSVTIFTHGYRDRPLPVELLALVQNTNSPLVAAVSSIQILLAMLALGAVSLTVGLDKVNE